MEKYLLQLLGTFGSFVNLVYWIVRFVVLLTPENRKNLRSNVREIKSAATSNKKHLIIAIAIFLAAVAFLVFSLFDEPERTETTGKGGASLMAPGSDVDQQEENALVEFGGGKKKIEWYVIEKNKKYWTLISKNCFDARPYQTTIEKGKKLTWEKSTLKAWLNSEFVKNFSESERNAMVEFSEGGSVSLLDIKQAKKLEKENRDLLVCRTESQEESEAKTKEWWLQTPKEECVMFVKSSGKIQKSCTEYFDNRADKSLFVRPVIREKIEKNGGK